MKIIKYGTYYTWENNQGNYNTQCNRACDPEGYSLTIPTIPGLTKVLIGGNMLRGGKQLNETIEKNIDKFKEGKVLNMDLYNRTVNEELSQTLTDPTHNSQRLFDGLRIRKLTPRECWRLMGFDDIDFDKTAKVNSNTQLYKQAGNSIVVNVLEAILFNLLIDPAKQEENIIEGQTNIYDFIHE